MVMKNRQALATVSIALIAFMAAFVSEGFMNSRVHAAQPVKIGYAISLSGVFTSYGEDLRDALNLYMDQIGHKVAGRNIEIIVEDIGSNQVNRALDVGRKLIQKNNVDILAGVIDTGSAYALATLVEKHKIPFVISNAGADDLTQRKANPYVIRVSFTNSGGSHPLGVWAYEKGYRKAVVMGSDYGAGYEHVGGICQTFKKMGGKIIQEIWPPLGNQDFAPYLANVNREADVVMVFFAASDALRFVKQYEEYGLKKKIPLIGKGYYLDDNILPKLAESAEGLISESHWCFLLDNPENIAFNAAYIKKYGRRPTNISEQGYITGMVIAKALEKTKGEIKSEEFVKVMRSLELKAPRGTINFDKYGEVVQTYYIRKVEKVKGEWQSVPFKSYPAVSQFWTWTPEEYMKLTPYMEMKGKWAE
jgi:branched-chain amino acid transport system substrate-binding protein